MAIILLRLPTVIKRTGKSKSSTYIDIQDGLLPPPVKIGPRASGWPDNEIDAVNAAVIAGKSKDEIRALVADLVDARTRGYREAS